VEILQRLPCSSPFASDAREVDIWSKTACSRCGTHANWIVTERSACIASDTPGNDAGDLRQF